jgi:hypothetical protein
LSAPETIHPAGDSSRRPVRRNPSLLPREHGVYAEVAFPILTALWIGHASIAGVCFAIAVIAAFMVHEPVLVLLGRRGAWVKEGLRQQAIQLLIVLVTVMLVCTAIGLWKSTAAVRIAFLALIPLALPLAFMTLRKQEKSLSGEILIALIISLASAPIAMAGAASVAGAMAASGVWFTVFVFSTVTVHAVLARTKRHTNAPAVIVATAAVFVAVAAVVLCLGRGPMWALALIPAPLVCAGVIVAGLPVRRLKTLGWLLVLGNLATATLLILTLG